MKKEDIYYKAMLARDHRFDGKFFVGVKTTGIYCRPICPARPKRENVEFFNNHLEAEKAGYRPCMRCRPESAPLSPAWIGTSAIVKRAIKMLHNLESITFDENQFAERFGVSARHLRRLFSEEIGKTPTQISAENRLNLARKLIVETALPMTEIAFASGFKSIRRFNDAFKLRFKKNPTDIRRGQTYSGEGLRISLAYRPPFNFQGLLFSYGIHKMGDLEWFEENKMHRIFEMGGKIGQVAISDDPDNSQLILEINFPDTSMIYAITSRVRNMFDLDSDPVLVANILESDKRIKKILKKHPGIRLPSGWDPFEVAIATILGQLVSMEQARSLVDNLMQLAGRDSGLVKNGKAIKLFPSPEQIIACDLSLLKTTSRRKETLKDFCKALIDNKISLEPTQDVDEFIKNVMMIKGIGRWTADYMALKVLRSTDAFPSTDLILARVLEIHKEEVLAQMSPWRGYAATLFWREYSGTLTKVKKKKESK
jgi:AraC family transcriptional regulator of adaptative response / DNA-3-methyladenine glycosylase II